MTVAYSMKGVGVSNGHACACANIHIDSLVCIYNVYTLYTHIYIYTHVYVQTHKHDWDVAHMDGEGLQKFKHTHIWLYFTKKLRRSYQ